MVVSDNNGKNAWRFVMWLLQGVIIIVVSWVGSTLTNLNREMGEFKGEIVTDIKNIKAQIATATEDRYRSQDARRDFALESVKMSDLERRVQIIEQVVIRRGIRP